MFVRELGLDHPTTIGCEARISVGVSGTALHAEGAQEGGEGGGGRGAEGGGRDGGRDGKDRRAERVGREEWILDEVRMGWAGGGA